MTIYTTVIHTADGDVTVESDGSLSISRLFALAGLPLPTPCGNMGACGKCRVLVKGQIEGDTPDDRGFVRACLSYPRSDLTVFAPEGVTRQSTAPALTLHSEGAGLTDGEISTAGLAFDVGTTTLVGALYASVNGKTVRIATATRSNPQAEYGADVLSRISASAHALPALCASLRDALAELANALTSASPIKPSRAVFAGNTVMLHLLCGVSPTSIGCYPYTPASLDARSLPAPFCGIPATDTYVFPCASGFIGGDLLAGVLTLSDTREPTLLLDLGTNCEIALLVPNETGALPDVYATSAAAGPAMEGANLSCGMCALPGAVSSVRSDGHTLKYETIGNEPPRGLCGSALFDTVALLLSFGAVDRDGSLSDDEIPEALSRRMVTIGEESAFLLAENVTLTQSDIRAFQLAKSAVRCGIEVLLEEAGTIRTPVRVALAGAFGTYLSADSVRTVGLFPRALRDDVRTVGNTALIGASECLFSEENKRKLEALRKRIRVVELERTAGFEQRFLSNLSFGNA